MVIFLTNTGTECVSVMVVSNRKQLPEKHIEHSIMCDNSAENQWLGVGGGGAFNVKLGLLQNIRK